MKQGEFFGPRPDPKAYACGRTVKRAAAGVVDAHERTKRDFLTQAEVDRLVAGARGGRFGTRDDLMLLLGVTSRFGSSRTQRRDKRLISLLSEVSPILDSICSAPGAASA
jgi:hypothetical protein